MKTTDEIVEEFKQQTSVNLCNREHSCCWDEKQMEYWLRTTLEAKDKECEERVRETEQRYLLAFAGLDPAERHDKAVRELQALIATNTVRPCICGNRGYTALINDTHLEGCPNYTPTNTDKQ